MLNEKRKILQNPSFYTSLPGRFFKRNAQQNYLVVQLIKPNHSLKFNSKTAITNLFKTKILNITSKSQNKW
jgi:hypothetical protein